MATTPSSLKGYKIDFVTNTLTLNYKFAAAAQQYGSEENKLMQNIQKDFPGLTVVVKAGREQKSAHTNKRLTYANMEAHIAVYENADKLMEVFKTVKDASVSAASPYKYVADWFKAQFPNYKTAPAFKDGKLTIVPVQKPDIKEYKVKMPSQAS